MQDDLNGVGANVSIFATITLVIVSALNRAGPRQTGTVPSGGTLLNANRK
jgi:hypothetical protein